MNGQLLARKLHPLKGSGVKQQMLLDLIPDIGGIKLYISAFQKESIILRSEELS